MTFGVIINDEDSRLTKPEKVLVNQAVSDFKNYVAQLDRVLLTYGIQLDAGNSQLVSSVSELKAKKEDSDTFLDCLSVDEITVLSGNSQLKSLITDYTYDEFTNYFMGLLSSHPNYDLGEHEITLKQALKNLIEKGFIEGDPDAVLLIAKFKKSIKEMASSEWFLSGGNSNKLETIKFMVEHEEMARDFSSQFISECEKELKITSKIKAELQSLVEGYCYNEFISRLRHKTGDYPFIRVCQLFNNPELRAGISIRRQIIRLISKLEDSSEVVIDRSTKPASIVEVTPLKGRSFNYKVADPAIMLSQKLGSLSNDTFYERLSDLVDFISSQLLNQSKKDDGTICLRQLKKFSEEAKVDIDKRLLGLGVSVESQPMVSQSEQLFNAIKDSLKEVIYSKILLLESRVFQKAFLLAEGLLPDKD
jgi:hypothetical protein